MLERRLELHAADAEAAVADHHDDLLSGACELGADPHADAVPHRRQGSGVDDLPGEASPEPLREPAGEREAVHHERGVGGHRGDELLDDPRGMDGHGVTDRTGLVGERPAECVTNLGHLAAPRGVAPAVQTAGHGALEELAQHELRVADDGDLGRHVPADTLGCRIDLHVRRRRVPRRRRSEVLAAPELETDREHDVRAAGEGLLPRAAYRQRVILGNGALARAPRVDRDLEPGGKGEELGRRVGPEYPVARDQQRPLGSRDRVERAFDGRGVAGAPQLRDGIQARAGLLPRHVVLLVEDVGRDLDERGSGRRTRGGAKGEADVGLDGGPVEHPFRELRERPADLDAVGFLEGAELILGRGVLAGDADDGAAGEPGHAETGHGVREPAARRHREHAGATARAGIAVGGVRARLLVTHVDHLQVVLAQVGEDRPDVASVHREHVADAGASEHAGDDGAPIRTRRPRTGGGAAEGLAHAARSVHRPGCSKPRAREASERRGRVGRGVTRRPAVTIVAK